MSWIINFFKSLWDTITALIDLVINLVSGLFQFIANLPTFISYLTKTIAILPGWLLPFCTISITVSVLFIILGRGKSN